MNYAVMILNKISGWIEYFLKKLPRKQTQNKIVEREEDSDRIYHYLLRGHSVKIEFTKHCYEKRIKSITRRIDTVRFNILVSDVQRAIKRYDALMNYQIPELIQNKNFQESTLGVTLRYNPNGKYYGFILVFSEEKNTLKATVLTILPLRDSRTKVLSIRKKEQCQIMDI